jgi:hypothetical protein
MALPGRPLLLRLLNFWPPYLGAGIRLRHLSSDYSHARVEMKLRFWNRNYVGVHFGGSLYAMTDPFYMLLVMEGFRARGWLKDYVIWDKAAEIRFVRPGRGRVRAEFRLTPEQLEEFRRLTDLQGKHEPVLKVEVRDDSGAVVAEVTKTLYIRSKAFKKSAASS